METDAKNQPLVAHWGPNQPARSVGKPLIEKGIMNLALWIAAGVLAIIYVPAGTMALMTPKEKLAENPKFGGVAAFSAPAIKAIGGAEILGAAGVVLPQATGIAAIFTPIAATCLAALQCGAATLHFRRGEYQVLPINFTLIAVAAFLAVGRFAGWH
ncbi:DoxX family protein [Nocardia arthritidis]|nr:DoxX family protein [Nocardia arthritidis]